MGFLFGSSKEDKSTGKPSRPGGVSARSLAAGPEGPFDRASPHTSPGQRKDLARDDDVQVERDPFPELSQMLKPSQDGHSSNMSTEPGSGLSSHPDLKYAKFQIRGFPGEKHAVFIPDDVPLSQTLLTLICDALGKELPSMMLCGVSNLSHPASMTTPQLRTCTGFSRLMKEAKSSLGMDEGEGAGLLNWCFAKETKEAAPVKGEDSKALEDFANRVLERKVTAMVNSIANAAFQTNAWTFSGPVISNFEVFLQRCIESGETEVFSTVAAHMQDRAYMESRVSKSLMMQLFDNAEVMSPKHVDEFSPIVLPGDLWAQGKHKGNAEFSSYGWDYWSFDAPDKKEAKGHPLFLFPWPWADLFFLFYREKPGSRTGQVDWDFATEKKLDREAIPLQPDLLAPPGYVFIGGEARMKAKVIQVLQVARPAVIMDNTPGTTKQMALFLKVIKKCLTRVSVSRVKPFLVDGAAGRLPSTPAVPELLQALSPAKIMKYIEREFDSSGMDRLSRLTLSDVVGMLDLVRQRPQVFKDTICVVDPLNGADEMVVSQLSAAFCSTYSGSMDLPFQAVNRNLVLKGWRLHSKLVKNSSQLRRFSTGMVVIIALVMFASTVLAVVMVSLRLERDKFSEAEISGYVNDHELEVVLTYSKVLSVMNIFMLVLPISAGLLTTLQGHFQFSSKWANIHMASQQVVTEINFFLGNVGRYRYSGRARGRAAAHRQYFLKRMQDIVTGLSMAGIREGDFLESQIGSGDKFEADPEALQNHINLYLYNIDAPNCCLRKISEMFRSFRGRYAGTEALLEEGRGQDQIKDPTAPLTAETYMEMRIAPLSKYYTELAKAYYRSRTRMNIAIFVLLAFGSGLAAFGRSLWIPASVGLATFFTTLLNWMAPQESLTAINKALTTLNNLDLRWHGSSLKEQRSEFMKARLITITERVALTVSTTTSRAPLMLEEDTIEEEEYSDEDYYSDDDGYTSRAPQSRSLSRQGSNRGTPTGSRTPSGIRTPGSRYGGSEVWSRSRQISRSNSPRGGVW